jgi:CRISPR-associated Cas5-like protein
MIGGIVTSALVELLIYPVIYVLWRKRGFRGQSEEETLLVLPPDEAIGAISSAVAQIESNRGLFR